MLRRSFLPPWLRRAACNRRGAAAVEFAIIAAPFIFMLFAVIEIGMIFVANINLSNATMALARQIRTGGIMAPGTSTSQSSGVALTLADFKSAICAKVQIIPTATCLAQLQVDLRTQNDFANQTAPNPNNSGTFNNASLCYYSGSSGSVVQFRTFYLWPLYTPLLTQALVNARTYKSGSTTKTGNYYVLTSSEVFKIEQNSSGANNGSGC